MANDKLKEDILTLSEQLGVECPSLDGLRKNKLTQIFAELSKDNKPENEKVETPDVYVVVEGISITTKAGKKNQGDPVKPTDLANGQVDFDLLVEKGRLVKQEA